MFSVCLLIASRVCLYLDDLLRRVQQRVEADERQPADRYYQVKLALLRPSTKASGVRSSFNVLPQ